MYWNHLIARHAVFGDKLAVRTRVLRRARGQTQRLFLKPTRMIERHLVRHSQNIFWDARQWRLFFLRPYEKTPLSPNFQNGKRAGIFHTAAASPITSHARMTHLVDASLARRHSHDAVSGAAFPGLRYVTTSQPYLISKANRALSLPQWNFSVSPQSLSTIPSETVRHTSTLPWAKRASRRELTMAQHGLLNSPQAVTTRGSLREITFGRRFSGVRYATPKLDSSGVTRGGLALRFAAPVTHAATAISDLTWRPAATSTPAAAPSQTPPSRVATTSTERAMPPETAARSLPSFDIERLAVQVHNLIERRMKIARTRRGH